MPGAGGGHPEPGMLRDQSSWWGEQPSPRSPSRLSPKGVATDAKVGSELIRVVAVDADVGNNSLVLYNILGIRYIKQHSNDSEEVANIFSIGE